MTTKASADAAVARVLKLARTLDAGGETERAAAQAIRSAISGRETPPERPGRLVGRSGVAQWLIEDIGEETILAQMTRPTSKEATLVLRVARVLTDAMTRYGWDRPAREMERTPSPPVPSYEIYGDGKVLLGWEDSPRVRAEWKTWWEARPGRNSGYGGRPRENTGTSPVASAQA
jgi:hypothetical protein